MKGNKKRENFKRNILIGDFNSLLLRKEILGKENDDPNFFNAKDNNNNNNNFEVKKILMNLKNNYSSSKSFIFML